MVQYECTVDLLLGHIVLGMWGTLTSCSKNAFYASASMAATLAQNLKLDYHAGPEHNGFKTFAYGGFHPSSPAPPKPGDGQQQLVLEVGVGVGVGERTHEERRAVLACFCLCSRSVKSPGDGGWIRQRHDATD